MLSRVPGSLDNCAKMLTLTTAIADTWYSSSKKLFFLSFVSKRCLITVLFHRGLEAFYFALGHVNLIRNYYYYCRIPSNVHYIPAFS